MFDRGEEPGRLEGFPRYMRPRSSEQALRPSCCGPHSFRRAERGRVAFLQGLSLLRQRGGRACIRFCHQY